MILNKYSRVTIYLLIVSAFVALLLFVCSYIARLHHQQDGSAPSKELDELANKFKRQMNLSVSPCEDFYEYTCGKKHALNDPNKSQVSNQKNGTNGATSTLAKVREIVNNASSGFIDKQLSCFHKSCMAFKQSEWVAIIKQASLELFGNWTPGQVPDSSFNLTQLTNKLGFEADVFLAFDVIPDTQNEPKGALVVAPCESGLVPSQQFAFALGLLNIHFNETETSEIKRLGYRIEAAKSDNRITWNTYRTSVAQLVQMPQLGWIQSWIYNFVPQQVAVVPDMAYLVQLSQLLARTPARIVRNYIFAKWLLQQVDFYPDNEDQQDLRSNVCLQKLYSQLGFLLTAAYARRYVTAEGRNFGLTMVELIRTELDKMIQNSSWISEQSKRIARHRIATIQANVGYLDMMISDDTMQTYHQGLDMNASDFYANIAQIKKFGMDKYYSLASRDSVSSIEWSIPIFTGGLASNAYHAPFARSINILPTIMQGLNRPNYLNFGSLGSVIGHEFMHSLDTDGKLSLWLDNSSLASYQNKTDCIIGQYNGSPIEKTESKLDGYQTLQENKADISGFRAAARAYSEFAKRREKLHQLPEDKLPGLGLDREQSFWLSLASLWCNSGSTSSKIADSAATDLHSPARIRVNMAVSNLEEFSRAFNCPLGARLNPAKKCNLF